MADTYYYIVSDIDGDTQPTREQAIRVAQLYIDNGCSYCFIKKFEDGETTGEIEYLKSDTL